jgi:nicotinate-nucleotide adenylyltransferase
MSHFITASQLSKIATISSCEFTQFNPEKPSNICLYIGSFDPPHIGHQTVVNLLLNQKDIDYVMIVPTFNHCAKKNVSNFEHRINMIFLAFSKTINVLVCPVERHLIEDCGMIEKQTIDTIDFLRKKFYNNTFSIAMGSDLFNTLSSWKSIEQYTSVHINVIIRQNNYINPDNMSILINLNVPFKFLNDSFPLYNISSSAIKQMIINGQNPSNLMPSDVQKYIQSNPDLIKTFYISHTDNASNTENGYKSIINTLDYGQAFC